MLIINDPEGMALILATDIDPQLQGHLLLRQRQFHQDGIEIGDLGPFVIVEPGDHLNAIEEAAGVRIAMNLVDQHRWPDPSYLPSWEWCRLDLGWREIVYVTSDDGSGVVLFVPDRDDIDPSLLAIIRTFCVQPDRV